MGHLLLVLVLLAVLVAVAAFLKKGQPGASKDVTYDARRELFSPAERSFLGVLEQALGERFRVMGKVRLGDLVQPAKGFSRSQRERERVLQGCKSRATCFLYYPNRARIAPVPDD